MWESLINGKWGSNVTGCTCGEDLSDGFLKDGFVGELVPRVMTQLSGGGEVLGLGKRPQCCRIQLRNMSGLQRQYSVWLPGAESGLWGEREPILVRR